MPLGSQRLEGVFGHREQGYECLQEDVIPPLVLDVHGETYSGAAHLGHLPAAPASSLFFTGQREERKNVIDWQSCTEEWTKAPEGASSGSTDFILRILE